MFERFTTEARQVVLGAVLVAQEQGSPSTGTGQLLVSLAADDGPAGRALADAGVTGDRLRALLESRRDLVDGAVVDPAALASIGIDVDEVRRAIEATFGPGALAGRGNRRRRWFRRGRLGGRREERPGGHRPFTREAKEALERSLREALARRDRHIGSEHVLLGLIGPAGAPPASAASGLLTALGVDRAALRAALPSRRKAG